MNPYLSILILIIVLSGNAQAGDYTLGGGMSVVNKSSNGMTTAIPDKAETPSPDEQIPIPDPNIGTSSDFANGTKKVKANGYPTTLRKSDIERTEGDESGVEVSPVADNEGD